MTGRIVVIGAGITGAAIARTLADAGSEVMLLDAGVPSATPASFGWVNASFHLDEDHFRLRARAMALWPGWAERYDLPFVQQGAYWWEEQGAALAAFGQSLSASGYAVQHRKSPALPGLVAPPAEALFFPQEGFADAAATAAALLAGLEVHYGVVAGAIETNGGRVSGVAVPGGVIAADRIIVAAGNGAAGLAASVGLDLPMLSRPGVLALSRPVERPEPPGAVMVAPGMEFRWAEGGRLLAPTSPNHQSDETEALSETPRALALGVMERLAALTGQDVTLERLWAANRPVPGDGLPVLGQGGPEGLFWAVLHSGVTLAPVVAELTADAVKGAPETETLMRYGIDRFQRA